MPTDVTRALDFIILDILAVSCGLGYRVMNKNHGMPAAIVETLQPHITELLSEIIEHSGVFRQNIVNFWIKGPQQKLGNGRARSRASDETRLYL